MGGGGTEIGPSLDPISVLPHGCFNCPNEDVAIIIDWSVGAGIRQSYQNLRTLTAGGAMWKRLLGLSRARALFTL